MEILSDVNLIEFGFVGLMSFGSVGVVIYFTEKKRKLTKGEKFLLFFAFAFVWGLVPAEFGNVIADRIKVALAIAVSGTAAFTGIKAFSNK